MKRVVIIGAGHAGGAAAAALRQYGHSGEIVLIGDEPVAPYQRPPLSKAWLKGELEVDRLLLRPDDFYADNGITLRLGQRVEALDPAARTIGLSDGARLDYDAAILATGSHTRRLPVTGGHHPAVLALRDLADAERLRAALRPGARIVIVGAGYVGLEVAASARLLGCEVVVLEREARVLPRVASETLSTFYTDRHRAEGVDIICGADVVGIEDEGRRVRLADGGAFEADAVLVGVGARACDDLAIAAGLACADGVRVDEHARTSARNVYAIGDCTRAPAPLYGVDARIESVPNALLQAKQAAAAIAGAPPPPAEVPWFWSDQYDVKLQIVGLPHAVDRQIVRGEPNSGALAVFHLSQGVLQAVEAINAPQAFMIGRKLIERRARPDPAALADPTTSLKDVASAA